MVSYFERDFHCSVGRMVLLEKAHFENRHAPIPKNTAKRESTKPLF